MTDRLETAKQRYFTEVGRQIRAINSAIVVIGLLAIMGLMALSEAESQIKADDLRNQEVSNAYRQ
jgi:hypothetical protein